MAPAVDPAIPTKLLTALKDMPAWLLCGAAITLFVLWKVPALRGVIPDAGAEWLPAGALLFTILALCNVAAVIGQHYADRRRAHAERDRLRLMKVYRPLA